MAGHLVLHTNPVYPPDAKAKGISGTVSLQAVIGKDGAIKGLTVISGPPELAEAAKAAVQNWIYEPYTLNGEPTEVATTINVNFNLGGESSRVRVSSGVMAGLLISKVPPAYPIGAKNNGVQGAVVLSVVIGKDGGVHEIHVVSGPSELQNAAIDAAKQWRYRPYMLNGQPVEVQTTLLMNFHLHGGPTF